MVNVLPPSVAVRPTPGCKSILPGAGWIDFDPTNNIVGNRNLIRVAVAWDPQQAVPLWGSFIGSTSSFRGMEVEVNVTEENGYGS